MIHRFSFSNFFSFRDEQIIDFTVNDHAPDTESYVDSAFRARIGKVLVLFGHNASGKTNVLRVLSFIRWFIVNSFEAPPEERMPFWTFAFGADAAKPSRFSIQFEMQDGLFTYEVVLAAGRVVSEEAHLRQTGDRRARKLFSRTWNEDAGEYETDTARIRFPKEYEAPKKRRNASLVALGAQINSEWCERIKSYWQKVWSNQNGEIFCETKSTASRAMDAADAYSSDREAFERAKEFIRQCDLGLKDIFLIEEPNGPEEDHSQIFPIAVHALVEREGLLPFVLESGGTQELFVHLASLLPVVRAGGVAVVDDIDADLHQLVIPKLIDLFVSRNTNPNNAQLICSCHSTPLLNHLDKYQVLLAEKDEEQASSVWRLDDVRVRSDDNYYAKYMAGAYGAVPNF